VARLKCIGALHTGYLIIDVFNNFKIMKSGSGKGHLNWKGEWIPDSSPFDDAGEYSLKQDLIKEFLSVARKYQGRIKDKTIAEAAMSVAKKYEM